MTICKEKSMSIFSSQRWYRARMLGACVVASAAMVATGSPAATMTSKKDAPAAAPPAAKDAKSATTEASKKKDMTAGAKGVSDQEAKLAPSGGKKSAK